MVMTSRVNSEAGMRGKGGHGGEICGRERRGGVHMASVKATGCSDSLVKDGEVDR